MSNSTNTEFSQFHWLFEMLQNSDVGLVVLDRDYRVELWNSFMENHSGLAPHDVKGHSLFQIFSEIPEQWLRHKAETVFTLGNRAFTIWEQRPYVFRFRNYRPITGTAEFMYQNITMIPLGSASGEISHICLIVYDVTDQAVSKQGMAAANEELQRLSRTDRLTELNNRGYWEECLTREYARYQRTQQKTSLVMFDIDHFKRVNDTYGHTAGDEVIRQVSHLLRANLRDTDIAGRYGGEEFGVILINTDAPAARFFAERLRRGAEKIVVKAEGHEIRFTISLGISELSPAIKGQKQWIDCADRALYRSKEGGRNQVNLFEVEELATAGK